MSRKGLDMYYGYDRDSRQYPFDVTSPVPDQQAGVAQASNGHPSTPEPLPAAPTRRDQDPDE